MKVGFKRKHEEKKKEEDTHESGPITSKPLPLELSVAERYPLKEPFVHAVISQDFTRKTYLFLIDELKLSPEETEIYKEIVDILQIELKIPRKEVDPRLYFEEHARKTVEKYRISLGRTANVSWSKILYYAERDMVGYGPIDPFMRDPNIEDVSIDGIGKPVYVWHRKYENLESNLMFDEDRQLDETITRLVHLAGKHISTAYPVVDATLPGRHRLSATFRREVSPQGSTLTIRKFREDPVSIIDMLNFGTISRAIAAYCWILMENRASTVVVGATAAGKTTALNALLTMLRPNWKLVTIEEVQEINVPHQNWVPMVSRPSYGLSSDRIGEVSLFDLVKASLRMRPDILVVGEVRGEEAFVLFQAISTGHGGMCTLHADDVHSAMQRLTSKPMDVAPSYIPFLDLVVSVRRVALPSDTKIVKVARRIITVDEVLEHDKYLKIFEWDPARDVHMAARLKESFKLRRIAKDQGLSMDEILEELERRVIILEWLQQKGIRNYKEIGAIFEQYHNQPGELYERIAKQIRVTT